MIQNHLSITRKEFIQSKNVMIVVLLTTKINHQKFIQKKIKIVIALVAPLRHKADQNLRKSQILLGAGSLGLKSTVKV